MADRSDAKWCGEACRKAVSRAFDLPSHADVPAAHTRRRTSDANATGFYLTPDETTAADLRVRVLGGLDEIETLAQWRAVGAMPAAPGLLGLDGDAWAALGERLGRQSDEVRAWLARQPLLPGEPR